MTPSPDATEVHEISDISSSNIAETEEDVRISDIEEKFCCTSMQTFTDYHSDPFASHDLDFPANSCRIACTKMQNFEEEESRASTVLVNHLFEYDINLIGSDMIYSDLI